MIDYHANPNPKTPDEMSGAELEFYNEALRFKRIQERQGLIQRYLANREWFDQILEGNKPAFG